MLALRPSRKALLPKVHWAVSVKLGVFLVGALTTRALLCGVYIGPLSLESSHLNEPEYAEVYTHSKRPYVDEN